MENIDNEVIWKDVIGYEGLYKVSKYGFIKSIALTKSHCRGGLSKKTQRILKTPLNDNGYPSVCLFKNGKGAKLTIHRIVAQAFVQNPNNYPVIDHINAIRVDSFYKNLRWCTPKMNGEYKKESGRAGKAFGEANALSKLTTENVIEMRELYKTSEYSYPQLADRYGVQPLTAYRAITRKTWNHI